MRGIVKFAVYGFFFNEKFSFSGFRFIPVKYNLKFWDEVKISKEKYQYNLTGYIESENVDEKDFIFTMQTVLTFVQQQDVMIRLIETGEVFKSYISDFERRGCGAPFAFYSDLQQEIIEKLYCKIINEPNEEEFKSLVFKVTEPFHMRKNYIELTYYLYFSGLEAFCGKYIESYFPNIEKPKDASRKIAHVLEELKIDYIQVDLHDTKHNLRSKSFDKKYFLRLSLSTYSNLRNSLFHQNKFTAHTVASNIRNKDGAYPKEEVVIAEYEYNLQRLCNAVILKYINIHNSKLDCSKWYTRFPLIK